MPLAPAFTPSSKADDDNNEGDDVRVKYNTCSDYNIPINNNQNKSEDNDATTEGSATTSSVLDKGVVESRGIGTASPKTREDVTSEINSFLNAPLDLRKELRSLLSIMMFVTRLPVPCGIDIHPGYVMKGMCYFPVLGSFIGFVVSHVFDLLNISFQLPTIIAACGSTAVGWWLTGCFHEDGLSDSSDGIGGGWTKEQILKIMTDSRVGTYGCAVLILYTVTKVELLAALDSSCWNILHLLGDEDGHPWASSGSVSDSGTTNIFVVGCQGAGPALIMSHTLARFTAPYLIHTRDYIDDEQGPKSSFYAFMVNAKHLVSQSRVIFAFCYCSLIGSLLYGPATAAILIVSVWIFSNSAGQYAQHVLDGVMGDYLGATICLCELLILTLLLAIQQQHESLESLWQFLSSFTTSSFSENLTDPSEIVSKLLENERFIVLARFGILYFIYSIWCALVNYTYKDYNKMKDKEN